MINDSREYADEDSPYVNARDDLDVDADDLKKRRKKWHRANDEAREELDEEKNNIEWPEADVAQAYALGIEIPAPTVLCRVDGQALLYRGLANVIFGDGSAGKSSLAIAAAGNEIAQGRHVYCVDFELNLNIWLWRLGALGLMPEQNGEFFHYLEVRKGKRPPAILRDDAVLSVMDSMTGALDAYGYEMNDASGIESVYRRAIDPFTDAGLAALVIDHPGHGDKTRPMNSIRKINRVQGAMYRMVAVEGRPLAKGRTGESLLYMFKDNAGGLGIPRGSIAGKFVMASSEDGTDIRCQIVNGTDLATLSDVAAQTPMARKKQQVIAALQHHGELNATKVREYAKGKLDLVQAALDELASEGVIQHEKRGKGTYYTLSDGAK
jgi:hypothetical protein